MPIFLFNFHHVKTLNMALNLVDAAKNLLPDDLVAKAATSLDENESSMQKAIGGAIPSV